MQTCLEKEPESSGLFSQFKTLTWKHTNEIWCAEYVTPFMTATSLLKWRVVFGLITLSSFPDFVLWTKAVSLIVSESSGHLFAICIAFGIQSGSEGSQGCKGKWETTMCPTFTRLLIFLLGLAYVPHQLLVTSLQAVQLSLGDLTFHNRARGENQLDRHAMI